MTDSHPYNELYLESNIELHKLLFLDFIEEEPYCQYDFASLADLYMQTSEIRAKMDVGNWSALNKGDKQLLNSFDYKKCEKKTKEDVDMILSNWIATIYVLLNWEYNIPCKEISEKVTTKGLMKMYYPLHETSHENACRKIVKRFFEMRNDND